MTRLTKLICCPTQPAVLDDVPPAVARRPAMSTPAPSPSPTVPVTQRPKQLNRPDGAGPVRTAAFAPGQVSAPLTATAPVAIETPAAETDRGAVVRQELAKWVDASPPNEKQCRQSVAQRIETAFTENNVSLGLPDQLMTTLPDCLEHLHALKTLNLCFNDIAELPPLPRSLEALILTDAGLTTLPPDLPSGLRQLHVSSNRLEQLPKLPSSLVMLRAVDSQLTELPELPDVLKTLIVGRNGLSTLPKLPEALTCLDVRNNALDAFPILPTSIRLFCPANNPARLLPTIPRSVRTLMADEGQFKTTIDSLRKKIETVSAMLQSPAKLPDAAFFRGAARPLQAASTAAIGFNDLGTDVLGEIAAHFIPGSPDAANLAMTSHYLNDNFRDRAALDGYLTHLKEQVSILVKHQVKEYYLDDNRQIL